MDIWFKNQCSTHGAIILEEIVIVTLTINMFDFVAGDRLRETDGGSTQLHSQPKGNTGIYIIIYIYHGFG